MSADRGEYRAIRRVLLDGPDFQRLPERARWIFVVLKINLGPAGIDVVYPDALTHQLAAQSGATISEVSSALDTLERDGWIARESNVLWVIGQLENDPHVKASDPKHRKSVVRHVAGLPRLDIVRAFVGANKDFFPPKEEASKALAWAIEGPSKGHRSTRTKTTTITTTEFASAGANGTQNANGSWTARLAAVWTEGVGDVQPGRIGAALKSAVDRHGAERVERAMRAYIALQKSDNKPCKLAWFAEQSQVWIERTASPLSVIEGEMSPTLDLLTRPTHTKASA